MQRSIFNRASSMKTTRSRGCPGAGGAGLPLVVITRLHAPEADLCTPATRGGALGISPTLVILTYCMADGFTDVILPTNPVLLIGLSMANVSYGKWLKWTWKLQLILFVTSIAVLLFGVWIGY